MLERINHMLSQRWERSGAGVMLRIISFGIKIKLTTILMFCPVEDTIDIKINIYNLKMMHKWYLPPKSYYTNHTRWNFHSNKNKTWFLKVLVTNKLSLISIKALRSQFTTQAAWQSLLLQKKKLNCTKASESLKNLKVKWSNCKGRCGNIHSLTLKQRNLRWI